MFSMSLDLPGNRNRPRPRYFHTMGKQIRTSKDPLCRWSVLYQRLYRVMRHLPDGTKSQEACKTKLPERGCTYTNFEGKRVSKISTEKKNDVKGGRTILATLLFHCRRQGYICRMYTCRSHCLLRSTPHLCQGALWKVVGGHALQRHSLIAISCFHSREDI